MLLVSFGGPEGQDDVLPFLRNVTRGRGIPDERLEEVAHHYRHFGGVSPINAQNRALRAALGAELDRRGLDLPVLWGNRNWDPYLADALREAHAAGHRRLLAVVTSAYSSYSGCRQYREDLAAALEETGLTGELEIDKVRQYFDHPGFVSPFVEGIRAAVDGARRAGRRADPEDVHVLFATHSIPRSPRWPPARRPPSWGGGRLRRAAPRRGRGGHGVARQRGGRGRAALVPRLPVPQRRPAHAVARAGRQRRHPRARRPRAPEAVVIVPRRLRLRPHGGAVGPRRGGDGDRAGGRARRGRVPTPASTRPSSRGWWTWSRSGTPPGEPTAGGRAPGPALTPLGPWYDVCRAGCCANPRGAAPAVAGLT